MCCAPLESWLSDLWSQAVRVYTFPWDNENGSSHSGVQAPQIPSQALGRQLVPLSFLHTNSKTELQGA